MGLQPDITNRVPVNQIKNGKIINTFKSLKEAQEKTGILWTNISAVLRKEKTGRNSAGGYQWERSTTMRKQYTSSEVEKVGTGNCEDIV